MRHNSHIERHQKEIENNLAFIKLLTEKNRNELFRFRG